MNDRSSRDNAPATKGYAPSRRPRWGTLVLVALLHLAALAGLVRVFAPDFTARVIEDATSLVTVTVTTPPEPETTPEPDSEPDAGAAGEEGREATPREVAAPEAPVPRPRPAPRASSTGADTNAGAREQGEGTGAAGDGEGTGSGGAGSGPSTGSGRGGARPLELISGWISNSRDYPTPPGGRQIRRGHDVVIELTVGPNGRVQSCRVTDPSPDPEADAITCRLATERFVFRPRLDANGDPVVGIYRWRQRWF